MSDPTINDIITAGWDRLPAAQRAELLRAGVPFPGETAEEVRARLKATFCLLDDADLTGLLGISEDSLARHRVNGTGPRPVRVARGVFYKREDVAAWLDQHRVGAPVEKPMKTKTSGVAA